MNARARRLCVFLLMALGAAAPAAAPGATVITEEGRILVGEVVRGDADTGLTLRLLDGELVEIASDNIAHFDPAETPPEAYARKRRELPEGDAEAHYRLGLWCRENGLREQGIFEMRMAILHNPDHAEARAALGYRREGEAWVDEETYMTARGFVQYRGRWMLKDQAERLESSRLDTERREHWTRTVGRMARQIASADADHHRELAIEQFAQLSDPFALELAERHIRDGNPHVRRAVLHAIVQNRREASYFHIMNAVLKDDSAIVRSDATGILAQVGDARMMRELTRSMRSAADSVRRNAAEAAARIDDPGVFAELVRHIHDNDESIRLSVIAGIQRANYRQASQALQAKVLDDRSRDVRAAAARAVAHMHRPGDSLKTLIDGLGDRQETVRHRAAEALMLCGDPVAVPHLIEALYTTTVRKGGDATPVLGDRRDLIDPAERNIMRAYHVNEAALVALVDITRINFNYNKTQWSRWWQANGAALIDAYAERKRQEADRD